MTIKSFVFKEDHHRDNTEVKTREHNLTKTKITIVTINFPVYEVRLPHDFEGYGTQIIITDVPANDINKDNIEDIIENGLEIHHSLNGFGEY